MTLFKERSLFSFSFPRLTGFLRLKRKYVFQYLLDFFRTISSLEPGMLLVATRNLNVRDSRDFDHIRLRLIC